MAKILGMEVREKIARAKYVSEEEIESYIDHTNEELIKTLEQLTKEEVSA